jgi:hypothetical protein
MALQIGQTLKLGSGIRTGVAPGQSQFGVGAGQSVKILGSRNVGGQLFYDIKHIGGGTGWTPASSLQKAASAGPQAAAKKGPSARVRAGQAFTKDIGKILAKPRAEEEAFLRRFRGFVGQQEPLPELRQRLLAEAGVPELQAQLEPLRQQALRVGQQVQALPEDIIARTRGQMLTEAQRRQIESAEARTLERRLSDIAISQEFFAGQLTGAQQEAGEQLGAFQAQFERELLPFDREANIISVRAAREVTGYTAAAQARLDAILGDIERAEELSDAARQIAHDFALLEREAVLQERQIRLRAGLSQGATAAKEARRNETLRQISRSLSGGVRAQGKAGLIAMTKRALTQFPEFQEEIRELANSFSIGLK